MTFLIWAGDEAEGHCTLDGEPYDRGIHVGESVAKRHQRFSFRMSDDFPDDTQLSDNFDVSPIVISAKLKRYLQKQLKNEHIEYLPVSILDHAGKLAAEDYFILHPTDVVDCIDLEASKVSWFDKKHKNLGIQLCKGLVLKPEVAPSLRVFRPAHWAHYIMVDEALARAILKKGFTGLFFVFATGFNGIATADGEYTL